MQLLRQLVTTVAVLVVLCVVPVRASDEGAQSSGFELSVQAGDKLLSRVSSLPIFKVYDRDGKQILDVGGLSSNFRGQLESLVKNPPEADADAPTLADELSQVVTEDSAAVDPASLPQADLTFVKYWADWCVPCHTQSQIVKDVKAAHPTVRINVIHVEADMTKR